MQTPMRLNDRYAPRHHQLYCHHCSDSYSRPQLLASRLRPMDSGTRTTTPPPAYAFLWTAATISRDDVDTWPRNTMFPSTPATRVDIIGKADGRLTD